MGKLVSTGEKWMIPLVTGSAASVIANQLPQNQRSTKRVLERVEGKKKVKKNLVPIIKSDDPMFNHEAAQKAAEMVMKMDLDEARVFTALVVGDVLEQEIDDNLRTLQRHVNETAMKTIDQVKKSIKRTVVSKNVDLDEVGEYIDALDRLEQIIKADQPSPYDYGYRFKESDFRRDHTGRFTTKIKIDPHKPPLNPRQHSGLDIDPTSVSPENLSQYQQEYIQIADFLNNVAQHGQLGENSVHMVVQNKATGERHIRPVNRKPVGGRLATDDWDPDIEHVVAVEARPNSLKLGGAAFGLSNTLGAPISGTTAGVLDRTDSNFSGFKDNWGEANAKTESEYRGSNERLYGRIKAGSQFLSAVAPKGSHAQIAARFGEFVGSRGPEAEKVFGPRIRSTGYRYRGTEKRPDQDLLDQYDTAVGNKKRQLARSEQARFGAEALSPDEEKLKRTMQAEEVQHAREQKAFKIAAESGETIQRTRTRIGESGQEERVSNIPSTRARDKVDRRAALTADEHARAMARGEQRFKTAMTQVRGGITESGMAGGREVVARHLMTREYTPKRGLYGLHLDAGNTPPSEGVIIDSKGKIAVQAIGYGDDHYLPFNLKNLGALKGGEYIRTRSVGGPTSEDIYTGLVSGARRIQVESRSGTFVVEFENDFRGGRRYNDKARRMVSRYQQILDSVQSETVDRADVPKSVRDRITEEVNNAPHAYAYSTAERQKQINTKIQEFKANPEMTKEDEERLQLSIQQATAGLSPRRAQEARDDLIAEYNEAKEYKYRLNGLGYQAALDALQEQFPYYIKTRSFPKNSKDATAPDKGYVEPDRNRPTEAKAGLHGTSGRLGEAWGNKGRKFSASRADYQGWKGKEEPLGGESDVKVEDKDKDGKEKTAAQKAADIRANIANRAAEEDRVTKGLVLAVKMRNFAQKDDGLKSRLPWLLNKDGSVKDDGELKTHLRDPANARAFDVFIEEFKDDPKFRDNMGMDNINEYLKASGRVGQKPFVEGNELMVTNKPYDFSSYGPAYSAGAEVGAVDAEVAKLDLFHPITSDRSPSEMSDKDLVDEITALGTAVSVMGSKDDLDDEEKDIWLGHLDKMQPTPDAVKQLLNGPGTLKSRLTQSALAMQKMRALKAAHPDLKPVKPVPNAVVEQGGAEAQPAPTDYKDTFESYVGGLTHMHRALRDAQDPRADEVRAAIEDGSRLMSTNPTQASYEAWRRNHADVISTFEETMRTGGARQLPRHPRRPDNT